MTKNITVTKPGSLRAWLDFLEKIDPNKITLGLERVSKVLKSLNLDLSDTKIIEVAGTNGKGSTAALVAASLTCSGISSGLYTSPHLNAFNERIVIDGVPVKDEDLCEAFSCVYDARGDVPLSYFEYTTLAAIVCFIKAKVKVMVLEIGLGGRLDAVNALDADIAVITSIGLDHTAILGKSIKEIAGEKAGIIKKECAVVTGILSNEALLTVKEKCKDQNATLYAEGTDFYGKFTNGFDFVSVGKLASFTIHLPYPKIPKCCAPAALKVITLLREMGYKITLDAIKDAVKSVSLPGRMQLVNLKPVIYLDVAHNPPAAAHLVEVLKE
ncbi:MAG: bifunctional folylpolyglutamate synthase/dihydrofolate synthase, partial [Succinivibrio sp.]